MQLPGTAEQAAHCTAPRQAIHTDYDESDTPLELGKVATV